MNLNGIDISSKINFYIYQQTSIEKVGKLARENVKAHRDYMKCTFKIRFNGSCIVSWSYLMIKIKS